MDEMTTPSTNGADGLVVVLDLDAARVCWGPGRDRVAVRTVGGQLLGAAPVAPAEPGIADEVDDPEVAAMLAEIEDDPQTRERAAVFDAFDDAARTGRLRHGDRLLPVAWYNPFTAQVAVGPSPSRVFRARQPVPLPPEGAVGVVDGGTLTVAGVELERFDPEPSVAALSRTVVSHHT